MQKHSDPSGFLAKCMGNPHGDKDSHIVLASSNSSSYFLISNYSEGLCLYIDFLIGLVLSARGISCMSPSFHLGGVRIGNNPGNISRYLHNTIYNDMLFFLSIFSKYGIAPSGRSLSLYNISYRSNMGLLDIINYLPYVM